MRTALKRPPAMPDTSWVPPQTLWRVTSFLVFALMFGLSHAASLCVSLPADLQNSTVECASWLEEQPANLTVTLPEENSNSAIEGTGNITGMVTDTAGNPIEGIQVAAYSWDDEGSKWDRINSDLTSATGSYNISGLGTDTYRVRFKDSSGTYAREFYNDAPDIGSAMDVAVTNDMTTSGIDAQLVLAGHITGMVTDSAGNPLAGIHVAAYRWTGSKWDSVHTDLTSATGSYDVGGLSTGTYHVRFRDFLGDYATEYYNNASTQNNGTDIAITAGETTSNINALLGFSGKITGTVTDTAENALERIHVAVYRWAGSRWEWANGTMTDASGNYTVGDLKTGTYRVQFKDLSGIYAVEYYNDVLDFDSAEDLAIRVGTTLSDINAELALAGNITGMVTDLAGNPLVGIEIGAYRWNGSYWSWVNISFTNESGYYNLSGLAAGSYLLRFLDNFGTYAIEYYDNALITENATLVAVTAETTTPGIDAQLSLRGNVTGMVTNSAGEPLAGIQVTAYLWNGNHWLLVNYDSTDASGNYDIGSLNTGRYRIRFMDHSGEYATEYYNDVLDFDNATNIVVTAGMTTPDINAELILAGHITGKVKNLAGEPLEGIQVVAYSWNESESSWIWVHSEFTNEEGRYDIGSLETDTYRVRFRDPSGTYAVEYYKNDDDIDSAMDIEVTLGAITSNINAELALAAHITGMVKNTAGNPLVGIHVAAYRWNNSSQDWEQINSDFTDSTGNYDINGLNTGTYHVRFKDPSGYYATLYYDNASSQNNGTDIPVTVDTTTSNINAQLVFAGHITGRVTDSAGNALMGIEVAVYRWNGRNWRWVDFDLTSRTGRYDLDGLNTGTYRVRFMDPLGGYVTEYYNDAQDCDAPNCDSAENIIVTAGMSRINIDAELAELVIMSAHDDVVIDFGSQYGLWVWMNNESWTALHPFSADSIVTGDLDGSGEDDVIIDFGTSYGIWGWMNNTTWEKKYDDSPESMVSGDLDGNGVDDMVIDFGPGMGISVGMNNTDLVQLDENSSESMVIGDIDGNGQDDVVIDFGPGMGISVWMNNNIFVQLDEDSSESMVTGDMDGNGLDEIIIDFGTSDAIWVWMNNSGLVQLHMISSESMATGDMDGNGLDDVIIDFGSTYGIWVRMNNSDWVQLHSLSPESMVTGDIDDSGLDDVIIDFGAPYGIWVRMNNNTWEKLHPLSPNSMVIGNIDGDQAVTSESDTAMSQMKPSTDEQLPMTETAKLPSL